MPDEGKIETPDEFQIDDHLKDLPKGVDKVLADEKNEVVP